MNQKNILCALALTLIAGCSASPAPQDAFYTPGEWKETESVQQDQKFFPKANNYGTHPSIPRVEPMAAPKGFVPQWKGAPGQSSTPAGPTADQAYNKFDPDFGDSAEAVASGKGEQMLGHASWYGPGFHGKKTANGERYNQRGMTAAHKILPMGTWVKVTNQQNGKTVTVRVNDRGPYKKNRIIDLTQTAAQRLDFDKKGIVPVKLEVIRYPKGFDPKKGLSPYKQVVVQLAVFKNAKMADRLKTKLQSKYTEFTFMVDKQAQNYSVVAGPYQKRAQAKRVSRSLKAGGEKNFVRSLRK